MPPWRKPPSQSQTAQKAASAACPSSKSPGFAATVTCDECPWRRDVPPGRFPASRFRDLRGTVQQGFMPMFACHKTSDGQTSACVGYLMVEGLQNFTVRLAVLNGRFNPDALRSAGPLYRSYAAMERANRSPGKWRAPR